MAVKRTNRGGIIRRQHRDRFNESATKRRPRSAATAASWAEKKGAQASSVDSKPLTRAAVGRTGRRFRDPPARKGGRGLMGLLDRFRPGGGEPAEAVEAPTEATGELVSQARAFILETASICCSHCLCRIAARIPIFRRSALVASCRCP